MSELEKEITARLNRQVAIGEFEVLIFGGPDEEIHRLINEFIADEAWNDMTRIEDELIIEESTLYHHDADTDETTQIKIKWYGN